MAEKTRVHILAKALNVPSKTIIGKCHAEGIDSVKNHMSTLSAGLQATIIEWFSEGQGDVALETAAPVDLKKVRIKSKKKGVAPKGSPATKVKTRASKGNGWTRAGAVEVAPAPAEMATEETSTILSEPVAPAAEKPPEVPSSPASLPTTETGETRVQPSTVAAGVMDQPVAEVPPALEKSDSPSAEVTEVSETTEPMPLPTEPQEVQGPRKPIVPAGPQHVPAPAKLQGPRVVRYEAVDYDVRPVRRSPRPQAPVAKAPPGMGGSPVSPPSEAPKPGDKGVRRRGRLTTRRSVGRVAEAGERLAEWRDRDLAERRERLAGATGRRIVRRRKGQQAGSAAQHISTGPITGATVHEPIHMKEFCSETGVSFMHLFRVLKEEHGLMPNINMVLPTETAQLLALHYGIDLTVIAAKTMLDDLQDEFRELQGTELVPRPPVVAMLGHVDHGKTSLLDAIRKTRVVSGEDGGITQHLSSYHIQTAHGAVTFLDTPGHAAFTQMRARGAQVTDVVVLVVAADDGIMPQTVEAINHAKAAQVPIVVALNKIDLGDQNKVKIYGQLAELDLTPSGEWGGEVDVLPTSATTGAGVSELVEHLAALSSILELKSDPTAPACGTVLEAETKTGVGAVAKVLIQGGTLRVGCFVVCGNASGKVRALLDDRGKRIREAGPSVPVEVWGLDDVPMAGDKLYQVNSLQRAKDIASETKQVRLESNRQRSRRVNTLQEMLLQRDADEVPELNVILKGDVDGSIAALRQSLGELPSDEVKLSIRHAGVGPVNDSDVLLAATCAGIVVAYRVDLPVISKRLAEAHGVDVRSYRVIYDVRDDIKKALEGLLPPEENVESRATAEVREIFRLSRKGGVIAGSHITHGTIDRKLLVKVIRDGVVVRENTRISSLRRFKDDAKQVRAGLECGIKLEGFDDLHVGDVIEAYEIVKVARTL